MKIVNLDDVPGKKNKTKANGVYKKALQELKPGVAAFISLADTGCTNTRQLTNAIYMAAKWNTMVVSCRPTDGGVYFWLRDQNGAASK